METMFPDYDRNALNSLLRANEYALDATTDYILTLSESE